MSVERRPVNRGVTFSAGPGGVSAAMTETRLMTHQHLLWPESMTIRAACGRMGDPPPCRGLHQLA
jgi:hypothetical protein